MNQSEAELFLASCGASGPLRVRTTARGSAVPCEHAFARPFLLVGRNPRSCVRLEDSRVSRRHAYFQLVEGRLVGVDLGSRTGLVWPGGEVGSSGWVASSGVRLGSWTLFPVGDRTADEPPEGGHEWDPLRDRVARPGWQEATIDISGGEQPRTVRWRLSRMVTLVGASASCRVRLRHPSVSRVHCSLVWTPLGVWLVDLLSREGTRLNGGPVGWARIADGDEVCVGAYRLRFRYAEAGVAGQLTQVALETSGAAGPGPDGSFPALPASSPPGPVDGLRPVRVQGHALDVGAGGLRAGLPDVRDGARAPGASVAPRSGSEAQLLLAVVEQFNQMQRDICEQFHQTTLMMFRLFTTMHQEQAALIRDELQQIQRVTGELQALQRQVLDGTLAARELGPQRDTLPGPAPVAATQPTPASPGEPLPADQARESPPPLAPPTPDAQGPPTLSPGDVDAWLNRRIDELHAERRTRWQSVMNFLSGQ
jgi:pSer/pThr/pTyr-binding forkhead associated (FHA) protein